MKKFDMPESSVKIVFIWNLRYSRHFLLLNIHHEPIIFSINLNVVSSSKVFSYFNYMFLLIVLFIINKFISLKKNYIEKNNKIIMNWSLSMIY